MKTTRDLTLVKPALPSDSPSQREVEEAVRTVLRHIGEDPSREGLADTPRRVAKAWDEMCSGYLLDPADVLGTDFDSEGYDEMVVVPEIEFCSTCEHHMLPFTGHAWVGYLPNARKPRVVGLSKVARLVDCFAKRLQIQERMTRQVADAMRSVLGAAGVGVIVRAQHSCMSCRGVGKRDAAMVTTALTGVFRKPEVRAEFMAHYLRTGR